MHEPADAGARTTTFRARPEPVVLLIALFILALLSAFHSTTSVEAGESLAQITLVLYLVYRGILTEAFDGSSLVRFFYLLMVALCPFLNLLAQSLPGPELVSLCLALSVLIAKQIISLYVLRITVTEEGISCKQFFLQPVCIDWKDVEMVKCRVVNRLDRGSVAVSTNAKISIAAGRKRIAFSSLFCKVSPSEAKAILEKAGPAAIAWTLRVLKDDGEVPLGPVRLCKNGFKVSGHLYSNIQLGQDSISLEDGRQKAKYSRDQLANGHYLIEILNRARLLA